MTELDLKVHMCRYYYMKQYHGSGDVNSKANYWWRRESPSKYPMR